jgi:hypothetical protein
MTANQNSTRRITRILVVALGAFTLTVFQASSGRAWSLIQAGAQNAPQNKSRRPLPKPPKGSRGFEQYAGRDASTRLIGMGATRNVGGVARKPVAPLEGIALDARPFFLWEPAPQGTSYKFTLYEGDVISTPKARIVFEIDTKQPQLVYPADAPALVPGNLYSWRISAPADTIRDGSSGSVTAGTPVNIFVLMEEDAAPIKKALEDAGLTTAKTGAERLRQAQLLAEYGVWYDALRIAREVFAENPKDEATAKFYNSLIAQLDQ